MFIPKVSESLSRVFKFAVWRHVTVSVNCECGSRSRKRRKRRKWAILVVGVVVVLVLPIRVWTRVRIRVRTRAIRRPWAWNPPGASSSPRKQPKHAFASGSYELTLCTNMFIIFTFQQKICRRFTKTKNHTVLDGLGLSLSRNSG